MSVDHGCPTVNNAASLHVPEKWVYGQFVPVMMVNHEKFCSIILAQQSKEMVSVVSLKGLY